MDIYESKYLTMRDGVKIAVDVWRPRHQRHPTATILRQTRYFRSISLRWPWRWMIRNQPFDHCSLYAGRRRRFLRAGYAWVDVDARGSGASFGHRDSAWSQPEVADGREIVEWIIQQPWSDGSVGSLGISYDGTAAEMLATTVHPAVKAVAPRYSSCDSFSDIGFPGGLMNVGFIRRWGEMNAALDANRLQDVAGTLVTLLTNGVTPVNSDLGVVQRDATILEHRDNYKVLELLRQIHFADDAPNDVQLKIEEVVGELGNVLRGCQLISPASYAQQIVESGIPIYSVSGWWDGAYARAAALRFARTPNPGSRLLLGPWNHGGGRHIEPGRRSRANRFDHDGRLLQFFDLHVRGRTNSLADEPPVQYFTMVRSQWQWANQWPPLDVGMTSMFLAPPGVLSWEREATSSFSTYARQATTTGEQNRWLTQVQVNGKVHYPDRSKVCDQHLCFRSEPLPHDMEVTGHPVFIVYANCDCEHGTLLVYLEDIDPHGHVWMVSEGGLRLLHRRERTNESSRAANACRSLGIPYRTFSRADADPMPDISNDSKLDEANAQQIRIDLQPTSYIFQKQHRIQLSIAMSDEGTFENTAGSKSFVYHGGSVASRIELPVKGSA